MNETSVIAVALTIFAWSLLSEWLAARNLTGPLVLMVSGFVLGNSSWGIVTVDVDSSTVHHLAEITLALILFADASAVRLAAARHDAAVTARLLGIGLPLSILAGTGLALLLFPSLPLALAGLVAASLAPTDAALSASVIADARLPSQLRRVLNVESGLNDGIATPVVSAFIGAAATVLGIVSDDHASGLTALHDLVVGVVVGIVVAGVGGRLVVVAHHRRWTQHASHRAATLALAILSFLVAQELGGNPFVSAFVGGLVFGARARREAEESVELTEMVGSLLSLVIWFIFGAGVILPAFEVLDLRIAAYALASLTVVRMVPVALALLGAGRDRATVGFIGWFGPRGLASVVFALLTIEELGVTDPRVTTTIATIGVTVVFSIVAHGVSARPLTTLYVRRVAVRGGGAAR